MTEAFKGEHEKNMCVEVRRWYNVQEEDDEIRRVQSGIIAFDEHVVATTSRIQASLWLKIRSHQPRCTRWTKKRRRKRAGDTVQQPRQPGLVEETIVGPVTIFSLCVRLCHTIHTPLLYSTRIIRPKTHPAEEFARELINSDYLDDIWGVVESCSQ